MAAPKDQPWEPALPRKQAGGPCRWRGAGRDGPAWSRAAPGCREGALPPATCPRAASAAHLGELKRDFLFCKKCIGLEL